MNTWFSADRIKNSTLNYTVLVRASGTGSVDVTFWLNDEQARELALQLFAASQPAPATATTEAA